MPSTIEFKTKKEARERIKLMQKSGGNNQFKIEKTLNNKYVVIYK